MTERELFTAALNRSDPAERAAFLDEQCAGNSPLRQRIESLLADHQQLGSFMDLPSSEATSYQPAERPGMQIGPYKLLQQIGEGGMGIVYMAEQTEPIQRKVALKVIKPGMDSRQVIARFEAERQTLAMMDHVNIARVMDAGATEAGRPYFVMELVHGVSITKYCDDQRLTPRQRLELFVPVCQAIQHAHQKGIIHRDIKPSNVMVTLHDGKPVPKVIDFGVAKATQQKLTERTLFTQSGTMVGTLEYMSPEQAEVCAGGVDTRSDIYSLGVLLYELLTGTTPLSHKRMKDTAYAEILRIIKEVDPPKPSTCLSDSGEALASISANRQTEPARLRKLIQGELDWIVMRCLEKDRNRRYETANGFAQDLRRYLADEPVQACPPSSLYRFRKFAKRCKAAIAIASTAAAGLVLTVVLLAVSNRLIRQEQARTKQALELAEYHADEIRQGLERLKTANALLERARVYDERQQWDDAAAAYTKAIELRPDHAPAWERRGELYARLGLWELAAADVAKAAEMQDPADSGHWVNLALLRVHADDIPGYRRVYARMSERFRGSSVRHFNLDTIRVGTLAPDFSGDPAQLVELAQAVITAEPGEPWLHHALGLAHYRAGQYELAIERLRESPAADPNWVNCPLNYPFLAMAHFRLGQHDKARQTLDDAGKFVDQWTQARYESGQGDWVTTQGAAAQWEWWNLLALQLFFREAQELMGLPPPPDDPRLHVLRARAFAGLRRNFTADVEYAAALKLRPDDPQIRLEAHRSAGYSAVARKQWNMAASEFTKASELAPDDVSLWRFRAVAHVGAADMDAYRKTCQDMLRRFEKTTDSRVAGNVLLVCVLFEDALPDMTPLLPLAEVAAPWGHEGAYALGKSLHRVGRYEEALKSLDTAAKISRPEAAEWSFMAMAHQQLGRADVARHCLAQAARWIDEANRQTEDDLSGTLPAWHGWHEPVVCPLLFREAEELVNRHSGNSVQNSQETDQPASL